MGVLGSDREARSDCSITSLLSVEFLWRDLVMPFQPIIGLLSDCQGLLQWQARLKKVNAIFAGLVAARLRQYGPEVGFVQVRRNPSSGQIVCPQSSLGENMTLLRRF